MNAITEHHTLQDAADVGQLLESWGGVIRRRILLSLPREP
jgi:hypothetical protein